MKKVLVLTGDGINCEQESARAFLDAGGKPTIIHVNELLQNPSLLLEYSVFCIPGGFSFGDELRSGKILAEKMRSVLGQVFQEFTKRGGLTLGICNGFQVLIQLGAFTGLETERTATLATNSQGKFIDRWIEIKVEANSSPWLRGIHGKLELPIRHKEGKIVIAENSDVDLFQFPLTYLEDVNGSHQRAAAMMDPSGQILGLMPHPEAATHAFLNPLNSEFKEENARNIQQIFKNAIEWRMET